MKKVLTTIMLSGGGITALDVAKYLIFLADTDDNNLTNLRLQKLLYYAWGFYWVSFKKELFQDKIEAWKYGPVVRVVYDKYKVFDGGYINSNGTLDVEVLMKKLESVVNFLSHFYCFTKGYTTSVLVASSHRELPWRKTIQNGEKTIDFQLIKDFFESEKNGR